MMRKDKFGLSAVLRGNQAPDIKIGVVIGGEGLGPSKESLSGKRPLVRWDPHPLREKLRVVHGPEPGRKEKAVAVLLNVSLPIIRNHPLVSRVDPEPIKTILKFVPFLGDGYKFIKL